ncbi:hypothetical protein AAFF_G00104910 [Aldrovandia affinis]|uniref:Uncharacterized protein n=1 Tax=Aldrovandia affinis TaxID=143900 RepID=A0AAD7T1X1_9TELE|nr:hypothetical protein AAFF_G00104910 [Aldrovandia affinis]
MTGTKPADRSVPGLTAPSEDPHHMGGENEAAGARVAVGLCGSAFGRAAAGLIPGLRRGAVCVYSATPGPFLPGLGAAAAEYSSALDADSEMPLVPYAALLKVASSRERLQFLFQRREQRLLSGPMHLHKHGLLQRDV